MQTGGSEIEVRQALRNIRPVVAPASQEGSWCVGSEPAVMGNRGIQKRLKVWSGAGTLYRIVGGGRSFVVAGTGKGGQLTPGREPHHPDACRVYSPLRAATAHRADRTLHIAQLRFFHGVRGVLLLCQPV